MKDKLYVIKKKPYYLFYAIFILGTLSIPFLTSQWNTSITFCVVIIPFIIGICLHVSHTKDSTVSNQEKKPFRILITIGLFALIAFLIIFTMKILGIM